MNENFKSAAAGAVLVASWVIVLTLPSMLILLYDIRSMLK